MDNSERLSALIVTLKGILDDFYKTFGIADIITNSKFFELIIADSLGHELIPGHSGSRDAKDANGEYEYKHFKETSSNHSWTFNDFSDTTIEKLNYVQAVIFAHIEDEDVTLPKFDWYYRVPGLVISEYLSGTTGKIANHRKMTNVSPKQIETVMGIKRTNTPMVPAGIYSKWINAIFEVAIEIEQITGTKGVLTSNKFWEILVALKLGHQVLSEQAGHDAKDDKGNMFEYKVSKTFTWQFQDISEVVLNKYLKCNAIVLGKVDKEEIEVDSIIMADPQLIVQRLREKLQEKADRWSLAGKEIRRSQVSLSLADVAHCNPKIIYNSKGKKFKFTLKV